MRSILDGQHGLFLIPILKPGIYQSPDTHLLLLEEADLAGLHAGRLLQVGPHGVDDVDVVHLVARDAVRFAQLRAVLDSLLRNRLNSLALERNLTRLA